MVGDDFGGIRGDFGNLAEVRFGLSGSGFASTGLGGGEEGATLEEPPPRGSRPRGPFLAQNGLKRASRKMMKKYV